MAAAIFLLAAMAPVVALIGSATPAAANNGSWSDPAYDDALGIGDITSYSASYTMTTVGFSAATRAPENPNTSVYWIPGDFIAFAITLPGHDPNNPDYAVFLDYRSSTGYRGTVVDANGNKLCGATPGYTGAAYTASFPASCIGSPPSFSLWVASDFLGLDNIEYRDVAPNGLNVAGPIYQGSVPPAGNLDSVTSPNSSSIRATGWTKDPDVPATAISVDLYLDGAGAGRFTAGNYRGDVGAHGFDITIPASLGAHQLCAYGINDQAGANTLLGCSNVNVVNQVPVGSIDTAQWTSATGIAVTGWGLDADAGTAAVDVSFGFPIPPTTSVTASLPRADVGAAYPALGPNHGFSTTLTAPSGTPQVCATILNTPPVPGDGGTTVACKVPVLPPPTGVTATAGLESATLTWTPGLNPPGTPRTGYEVVVQPGGAVKAVDGAATGTTVEGLTGGVSYTFTVRSVNAGGVGTSSTASNAVIPTARSGVRFHPLVPFRALDSRTATGGFNGAVGGGQVKSLAVAGVGAVPANATAVVMNVTVTGGTAGSYLTVFPAGGGVPTAANLNFAPNQTVPNLVTAKVGAGGAVSFFNAVGNVDVVADVVGYYDDGTGVGSPYAGLTPVRLLDSRTNTGGWNGTPLGQGQSRTFTVAGVSGVPASATAVVMNVTVTGGTSASYLQAYPSGDPQPVTANLLFGPGQTTSNLVTVKLGADGKVALFNQLGSVHVVVDVVGYFDPGATGLFHSVAPTRLLDSRDNTGGWSSLPLGPGMTRNLAVAGVSGISPGASALVANLVAVQPTAGTYLTAYPAGAALPLAASLLAGPGQIIPNLTSTALGAGGQLAIYNQLGNVHVVLDAAGYYSTS